MNSPAAIASQKPSIREGAEALLRAHDVWKSYEGGSIQVLNGVELKVFPGQAVALCGPSGCGKSTLLHLLGGLDEPTLGRVSIHGTDLKKRDRTQYLRHEVGFVFQLHNLIPGLTLEENCLIPTVAAGTPRKVALARLHGLAERTGLTHRI